jgi:hypothetical protein
MTWKDFEKDQLLCDGKWIVCPKGKKDDWGKKGMFHEINTRELMHLTHK